MVKSSAIGMSLSYTQFTWGRISVNAIKPLVFPFSSIDRSDLRLEKNSINAMY